MVRDSGLDGPVVCTCKVLMFIECNKIVLQGPDIFRLLVVALNAAGEFHPVANWSLITGTNLLSFAELFQAKTIISAYTGSVLFRTSKYSQRLIPGDKSLFCNVFMAFHNLSTSVMTGLSS